MLSSNLAVEKEAGHDSKQAMKPSLLAAFLVIAGVLFVILR